MKKDRLRRIKLIKRRGRSSSSPLSSSFSNASKSSDDESNVVESQLAKRRRVQSRFESSATSSTSSNVRRDRDERRRRKRREATSEIDWGDFTLRTVELECAGTVDNELVYVRQRPRLDVALTRRHFECARLFDMYDASAVRIFHFERIATRHAACVRSQRC